ncbi:hypothetical protein GCM10023149_29130 [Mucilaginibacter gynuensis]|uniref:Uncharacterized protein n=1 Tax=Mucilaginibacter gynuensis TaxID=1302236 RepID=A0ABP8GLE3_9SPHI
MVKNEQQDLPERGNGSAEEMPVGRQRQQGIASPDNPFVPGLNTAGKHKGLYFCNYSSCTNESS